MICRVSLYDGRDFACDGVVESCITLQGIWDNIRDDCIVS